MKIKLIILSLLIPWLAISQKPLHVQGKVSSYIDAKNNTPLFGAEVFLKNSKTGAITDENGDFMIHAKGEVPDTLIIRSSGYYPDTIVITGYKGNNFKITLFPEFVTEEVIIKAKRSGSNILRLDPRNVEQLNEKELRKAACCNLSESFETNASVDVNESDGVSGSKRIQMMGLDGRFVQLQFENIPFMHNLDQPFGLTSVPGSWINSIQITKGAGTVANGYESMAGLINLEYYNHDNIDKLLINGYGSLQGRGELNAHGGGKVSKRWGTSWFVHASSVFAENDRNNDGFRDLPLGETFIAMNRWKYEGDMMEGQIGAKVNYTNQLGGQTGYGRNNTDVGTPLYGVGIQNLNVEVFGKTGFFLKNDPFGSIGLVYYGKYDQLKTSYGNRHLEGTEIRGYVNAMHETILGNTNHRIKSGLSFIYDDLDQVMEDNLPSGNEIKTLKRVELVPGAFSEYTYTGIRSVIVAGARVDYHNLAGLQFTPRVNYKINVTEDMSLRLTAGRGFRISNYMTDNMSMMATNLPWVVDNDIRPEVSWNFGGSYLWDFKLFSRKASWSADFYHTLFTNQLVVDRDESPDYIRMHNLEGQSFSNAFQTDFRFEPLPRFEIKLAYKFLDVKATTGGNLETVIMVPKHRGFINLGYGTRNNRWSYDLTFSVYGQQRLARVYTAEGAYTENNMSKPYPMLSAQVTHRFKKGIEVYIGGENLTDYRLKNPIVDVENPFGKHFDATRIYAPIYGINIYAGFRIILKHKK